MSLWQRQEVQALLLGCDESISSLHAVGAALGSGKNISLRGDFDDAERSDEMLEQSEDSFDSWMWFDYRLPDGGCMLDRFLESDPARFRALLLLCAIF